MKTHQLFCCVLVIITCCVFTLEAQTVAGEVIGYVAVIISMAVFSKNMIGRINI